MDKQIRDKFLTEAMGECWHEMQLPYPDCKKCGCITPIQVSFSRWAGFGKLWEWVQVQEWFPQLIQRTYTGSDWIENIHPDRFADAVYKYLSESV